MSTCKKCGEPLSANSRFCSRCGTPVSASLKQICPKCKSEVEDEMVFCNKCGQRLTSLDMEHAGRDIRMKMILISRESQFQCVGNSYKVVVNGNTLGKVPAGGAVQADITSDSATVEIICTTIMVNERRWLKLRLGEQPCVSFKVRWPGIIMETVYDAKVIERR